MLVMTLIRQHAVAAKQARLAVAPEGGTVERLEESDVGIAEDQYVFTSMGRNGDTAQLLHVPAAQRLRLQAEPDTPAEQAERVVQSAQPARQQVALIDDSAPACFQLAEKRDIATLDQDVMVRGTRDMPVEGLAQQAAAFEIRRIACRHHRRRRRFRQQARAGKGVWNEPFVQRNSPAVSAPRDHLCLMTRHKNTGLPTT
jgi:hypothetical protein